MYVCSCIRIHIRVESGSDDLDNLGQLGYFLVGQVGLIHKLNYLDITRISQFFRKQCWHLISEQTFGLMNALKYHWCETSLFFISNWFEACGVQRFYLQEVYARDQLCILPRMKKSMALFHINKFHIMLH